MPTLWVTDFTVLMNNVRIILTNFLKNNRLDTTYLAAIALRMPGNAARVACAAASMTRAR